MESCWLTPSTLMRLKRQYERIFLKSKPSSNCHVVVIRNQNSPHHHIQDFQVMNMARHPAGLKQDLAKMSGASCRVTTIKYNGVAYSRCGNDKASLCGGVPRLKSTAIPKGIPRLNQRLRDRGQSKIQVEGHRLCAELEKDGFRCVSSPNTHFLLNTLTAFIPYTWKELIRCSAAQCPR